MQTSNILLSDKGAIKIVDAGLSAAPVQEDELHQDDVVTVASSGGSLMHWQAAEILTGKQCRHAVLCHCCHLCTVISLAGKQ